MPRPADDLRSAVAAFPRFALLALERRDAAVGIADRLCAIVGGEDDDRVVQLAHVLQLLQYVADIVVHLLHAGLVEAPVFASLRSLIADHLARPFSAPRQHRVTGRT